MKTQKFEDFSKYKMINEIVDPITLSLALATLGFTVGSMLIDMHKEKKVMSMGLEDLKKEKKDLENDLYKALKKDQLYKSEKIQDDIDEIDFRISQLEDDMSKKQDMISKEERRIKRDLRDNVKSIDRKDISKAIRSAKDQANDFII